MSTAPGFRLGNKGLDGIDSTGVDDHQDGSSGILTQGGILLVGESFFDSLVEASAVEAGSTVVQRSVGEELQSRVTERGDIDGGGSLRMSQW